MKSSGIKFEASYCISGVNVRCEANEGSLIKVIETANGTILGYFRKKRGSVRYLAVCGASSKTFSSQATAEEMVKWIVERNVKYEGTLNSRCDYSFEINGRKFIVKFEMIDNSGYYHYNYYELINFREKLIGSAMAVSYDKNFLVDFGGRRQYFHSNSKHKAVIELNLKYIVSSNEIVDLAGRLIEAISA